MKNNNVQFFGGVVKSGVYYYCLSTFRYSSNTRRNVRGKKRKQNVYTKYITIICII